MTPEDLKQACRDAIDCGRESITLIVPSTRLCGKRGPIGELVCVNRDVENVVRFKAKAVLKFIEREERKESNQQSSG